MIPSAIPRILSVLLAGLLLSRFAPAQVPKFDHVVVVIMENKAYEQVLGSPSAPYLTELVQDPNAALFTQSFALTHPSQPNYLHLFSGSAQGVKDDKVPAELPFKTANLGAELLAKGFAFKAYSEDLPAAGFTGATSARYVRKHAPWVNWQGTGTNAIPAAAHVPFSEFPSDYSSLPTVAFVIPNLINDVHDGTVTQGDSWIKRNLDGYIQWAKTHNSLFIFTFDEDDGSAENRIPTFFVGQHVKKGSYHEHITHETILRTIEDMYSLGHAGDSATEKPITDIWDNATR